MRDLLEWIRKYAGSIWGQGSGISGDEGLACSIDSRETAANGTRISTDHRTKCKHVCLVVELVRPLSKVTKSEDRECHVMWSSFGVYPCDQCREKYNFENWKIFDIHS